MQNRRESGNPSCGRRSGGAGGTVPVGGRPGDRIPSSSHDRPLTGTEDEPPVASEPEHQGRFEKDTPGHLGKGRARFTNMANGFDFSIVIGGAAGQGIATPGNILARMFVRRGLHLNAYNAYQSIIRGGHILLTMRVRDREALSHGDGMDLLLCLNQDTMTRHLRHLGRGAYAVYNADTISPGEHQDGVHLCGLPVVEVTGERKNRLAQNTAALGIITHVLGLDFEVLESALTLQFRRKGETVVSSNVSVARAAFEYAEERFPALTEPMPQSPNPLAVWTGNEALAMGGASAGVKFYCAYPMSPSTGVLHWMAKNARELGIMVRQVEDEIGVANMAIGAAHTGARAMCATSGGGFALMTEAVGSAAMMEIPVVFINVMRAGPSTGGTHQDGAGGPLAGARGQPGRLRTDRGGAPERPRRVWHHPRDLQPGGPLPVSGHRALRPADLGRDLQRGSG